ncbi:MAG: hypothetical protein FWB72_02610 [Firmicutes bacterium]|nr:hypothetical protein [Bacillota bacterium]
MLALSSFARNDFIRTTNTSSISDQFASECLKQATKPALNQALGYVV